VRAKERKTMLQKYVVIVAAWLEIVVGAIFLTAPDVPGMLLFGTKPDGIGIPVARFAGIALIALGTACLPSRAGAHRSSVLGLLVFNAGVAILFAWFAVTATHHGILTWPAAIGHAGIAAALLPHFLNEAC
jgi:hypothetical protein